jgi:CDP-diacylglycerol pyrophosphatase
MTGARAGIGFLGRIAALAVLAGCGCAHAADRMALWKIVHGRCEPHFAASGNPAPCAFVDLASGEANGAAVLKDLVGATQFLLIPTRRISGIESADVLGPRAPNWFARAWDARRFVFERLGHELPRDSIGLAINAATDRTQDQLHIHVDCLRPDVRDDIARRLPGLADGWSRDPVVLAGGSYRMLYVASADLRGVNPFRLAVDGLVQARRDMANMTLVVAGVSGTPAGDGFVLLAGHADPVGGRGGHGENLLDHSCAIGR